MEWLNLFGMFFVLIIMVPNIIFAIKCKDKFENKFKNKIVELLEQIGRYGCMCFMIFNIPNTGFGFLSDEAFALYLIINACLVLAYCVIWAICFKKENMFKAISLSVLPSLVFLFSGFISHSVLLIISAIIFAPTHILISCKNASK
ncbi:MAG: hypothetical protein UE295_01360 [Acutalibacteraceae bacterium]|nr:hypothetical protein [Acutalibacteraceae bacterium]